MARGSNQPEGCLAAFVRLLSGSPAPTKHVPQLRTDALSDLELFSTSAPTFPYGIRDQFLSPTELAFYHALVLVVGARTVVCMKVRLADVFFVARPHEHRAAFNRIAQKHIDFLVCDPGSLRPLFGIELDDSSHTQLDRQERDDFVDRAFAAARLPLVRVRAQRSYTPEHIAAQIGPLLDITQPPQPFVFEQSPFPQPAPLVPALDPLCSACGVPMVVRRVARGANQGRRFYGCVNYPRCRMMRPLD